MKSILKKLLIILENLIDEFNYYLDIKGEFLYKQVIDVFKDRFKNKKFEYEEISSFIRYDKSLRNFLYPYLALIEENLKAELVRKIDLTNDNKFYKIIELDRSKSKLYFYLIKQKIFLLEIIKIMKDFQLIDKIKFWNLKKINDMRNKIMHHNILLFGVCETWKESSKNIDQLKINIYLLHDFLPEEHKLGFINGINKLIKKQTNFSRINLGELK